jgi:putative copper resistance protein D
MQHAAQVITTSPADTTKIEADKRFSEFNHRFAGAFVLLAGLLAVLEPALAKRFGWVRYLWSVLFLAPGVYLLIWSDPESWPTGNQTLYYVITQNMQVLQHKLFSVLLLGLGVVEFVRVRKSLRSVWVSSVFPILAGLGALLLLYHSPQSHAGMGPEAHEAMQVIEHQHLGFAAVGFGIALSKAFADLGQFHPRAMRNLFAALMCVLALLLLTYTE